MINHTFLSTTNLVTVSTHYITVYHVYLASLFLGEDLSTNLQLRIKLLLLLLLFENNVITDGERCTALLRSLST